MKRFSTIYRSIELNRGVSQQSSCLNFSPNDIQSKQRTRRNQLTQAVDNVIRFDGDTAAEAASMETSLEAAGVSVDDVDLLVAATARQHQATFVTADKKDFDKTPLHELMDIDIIDAS